MKGQKTPSAFSVLMGYAGRHKVLTYLSLILSAACGVLALMPFVCLWRIIKEVVEVAPTFSMATGITHNGWMVVIDRKITRLNSINYRILAFCGFWL